MYNQVLYFLYWLCNAILLYFFSETVGVKVVLLGNDRLNTVESAIYSGFVLTFLIWIWWDFAIAKQFDLRKERVAAAFFLFVNFFSLWAMSRFSQITGLYIENIAWVIVLSVLATSIQRIVWKIIKGK